MFIPEAFTTLRATLEPYVEGTPNINSVPKYRLEVAISFEDEVIRKQPGAASFDGFERLEVHFGRAGAPETWRAVRAEYPRDYDGEAVTGYHGERRVSLHTLTILDVPAGTDKVAVVAKTNVGDVAAQRFGEDFPLIRPWQRP